MSREPTPPPSDPEKYVRKRRRSGDTGNQVKPEPSPPPPKKQISGGYQPSGEPTSLEDLKPPSGSSAIRSPKERLLALSRGDNLELRKILDILCKMSAVIDPESEVCFLCEIKLSCITSHTTWYKEGLGCECLCEWCWDELVPKERVPFYQQLWDTWTSPDPSDWELIKVAVLEGK